MTAGLAHPQEDSSECGLGPVPPVLPCRLRPRGGLPRWAAALPTFLHQRRLARAMKEHPRVRANKLARGPAEPGPPSPRLPGRALYPRPTLGRER